MKRRVKNTFYTLSILGGLQAAAYGATLDNGSVTLPAYGGKQGPIQLGMKELLSKCDELERHEQVAKFSADITCLIDQQMWVNGRQDQFQMDYEPFFAEFDINVKGKFNSHWVPITLGQRAHLDNCQSVEQWRIKAIRTVKVQSCDELRTIHSNPAFCEEVFAGSSCVDAESIDSQIKVAQQAQQVTYDDQECHGERLREINTNPQIQTSQIQAQDLESGVHQQVPYQEVACSELGLANPINMVLRTVDLNKGGKFTQAVQVLDQGEMQDQTLAPDVGQMKLITGQFPRANDILWRINGRRVERAEEACRMLSELKTTGKPQAQQNQLKMSFYGENDLKISSETYEVGTIYRKHLVAWY